jgi:large subunit ribosomal protein L23
MVKFNEDDKKQAAAEVKANEEKIVTTKNKNDSSKNTPAKKDNAKSTPIKTNETLEDLGIIFHPLVTEKAVNMIESENKITFIVSDKAGKEKIRKVVESAYEVKVDKINVVRDRKGRKKAIVKLKKGFKADELATKLGVL